MLTMVGIEPWSFRTGANTTLEMFEYRVYLYPLLIFYTLCTVFGITSNIAVTMVTVYNRKLRSSCHILIALTCFADFIHQCGHFIFLFNLYSGFSTIPQDVCLHIQTVPVMGLCGGAGLLLSLCLDRLFAVVSPLRYRTISLSWLYLLAQLLIPSTYTVYLLLRAYRFTDPQSETVCGLPAAFHGRSNMEWAVSTVLLNVLILFVYLAVVLLLRFKIDSKKLSSRGIYSSIFLIVLIVVFGWFTTMLINVIAASLVVCNELLFLIQMYAGLPVNLGCSSNLIVYFRMSSEHRSAILETFPKLSRNFPLLCSNNDTQNPKSSSYKGSHVSSRTRTGGGRTYGAQEESSPITRS